MSKHVELRLKFKSNYFPVAQGFDSFRANFLLATSGGVSGIKCKNPRSKKETNKQKKNYTESLALIG